MANYKGTMQSFPGSFGDPNLRRAGPPGSNPLMMTIGGQRPQAPPQFGGNQPQQGFQLQKFNSQPGGQGRPMNGDYLQGPGGRSLDNHHDYYLGNSGVSTPQPAMPNLPGSLGYKQGPMSMPQSPMQPGNYNPLQRRIGDPQGKAFQSPQNPFTGHRGQLGNGAPSPGSGPQTFNNFNTMGNSSISGGVPGPRSNPGDYPGFGPRNQAAGGISTDNFEFKPVTPQSPKSYGHRHEPVHSIGDPNDPLSRFRANPSRVDLVQESRGKVGYSPKPKREALAGAAGNQHQAYGEKLVQSQLTFDHNPTARKVQPKPILKKGKSNWNSGRPKSATFNQEVLVHEVESWKIYNVDMAKEAKKNFRRESQSECRLV